MKRYSSTLKTKKTHIDTSSGGSDIENFYGLWPFNDPAEAEVDIIAVHGLNGHYERSFTHPLTKRIWLRDFLPNDIPSARVMSFSYDAQVISHSVQSLKQKADSLLRAIRRKRENKTSRPLILIGHSLGGILIKRALVMAEKQYPYILKATLGVVFMAVPHTGADITKWADKITTIAAPFFPTWSFRKETAPVLRKDSSILYDLALEFEHLSGFKVLSVNEAATTPAILGLRCHVVPATGLHVGKDGTTISVTGANHHTVCKFASSNNEFYQDVCFWLKEVINESLTAGTLRPITPEGQTQRIQQRGNIKADTSRVDGQENSIIKGPVSSSVATSGVDRTSISIANNFNHQIQHRIPNSTGYMYGDRKIDEDQPFNSPQILRRPQNNICSIHSPSLDPPNRAIASYEDLSQRWAFTTRPPDYIFYTSRPLLTSQASERIESAWVGDPGLHKAASTNERDLVRQLLLQTCSINEPSVKWPPSRPLPAEICNIPLVSACRAGYADIVEDALLAGADPNARDVNRRTALHVAVELRHVDVLKLLMRFGADKDLIDGKGVSAIERARQVAKQGNGSMEVLEVLQRM